MLAKARLTTALMFSYYELWRNFILILVHFLDFIITKCENTWM